MVAPPAVPSLPGLRVLGGSAPVGAAGAPGVGPDGQIPKVSSVWASFPSRCKDRTKSCTQPSKTAADGSHAARGWMGIWGGGGG